MLPAYEAPPPEVLDWAARQVGPRAKVTAVARFAGGLTAHMNRLTITDATGSRDVVLRRWPNEDWTEGVVVREASALTAVRSHGIPAPELLALDDGVETGVRCTLTTALPGQPDLCPADMTSWLDQLARMQAAIHAVPATLATHWDGFYEGRSLDWLGDPALADAAHEAASHPASDDTDLVHGDYQHFNVLWRDGLLTGVVDWPSAGVGSRGGDVGHCRLNLAVLFGPEQAADYLSAYESAAGVRIDRRADLRELLAFGPSWQGFIPRQVAGRAPLDVAGMPGRVAAVVREALDAIG